MPKVFDEFDENPHLAATIAMILLVAKIVFRKYKAARSSSSHV